MQGFIILLLSFIAACWIIVIGYHTGLFLEVSHLSTFTRGTLPLAYTGAALSVCGLVVALFAGALND